jgi:hypothetical protein
MKSKEAELTIIHDYQEVPGVCMPGEEIVAVILVFRKRRYHLPLGPTHMILLDYLARCRYGEDAWRISAQLQLDPFATEHGANSPDNHVRPARSSRNAIRQQIRRMRRALAIVIADESLDLDANSIIRSVETSTGTVLYSTGCAVSWDHWPQNDMHWNSKIEIPNIHPSVYDHSDQIGLSL